MSFQLLLFILLTLLLGVVAGYLLRWLISLGKQGSLEIKVKQMLLEAKTEAQYIVDEAEKKAEKKLRLTRKDIRERETTAKETEKRLINKEAFLDTRQANIDKEGEEIKEKLRQVGLLQEKNQLLESQKNEELQTVGQLSLEEARKEILDLVEEHAEEDILVRIQKLENLGKERMEKRAQEILAMSVHRLSSSVPSDILATAVTIPSDEVKGKVIGKEGRNIKAFERMTGVEVIIDDTPGVITLSSFDPVRRHVAHLALKKLIADGRIQPVKIEEMVEKARQEINTTIKEKGEEAAYECGVYDLDPRILSILGRLHFRTSYGQNVLQHSIEAAHIAGMIAEELHADVPIAKSGALLHDIGKAIDHEVSGTHVEIGRRILQKFGARVEIIQAMQSHHEEYPYETIESIIVQVADALSGSRPGARSDTIENYLKRLEELEALANSYEGVEKSYALQAGREVRIFVTPEKLSDLETHHLARQIALDIENELRYPGEIKITVVRESRVIEFAR